MDLPSKSLEQIIAWLKENHKISKVQVFGNAIQCLDQIEESPPDICIIRLGIKSIPGIITAGYVLATRPQIKVILISEQADYALDAFEIGACGYLLCPVEKEKLENALGWVG